MKFFAGFLLLAASASALPNFAGFEGFKKKACSLDRAKLPDPPSSYGAEYAAPDGLKVASVVLGTGTQNYTCASPSATPSAVGAKADLYDASCLAAFFPQFLHYLPGFILENPKQLNTIVSFFTFAKAGNHIFPDTTTPVFNLVPERLSVFVGKKNGAVPAPEDATPGQYGAVDWLDLGSKEGTKGGYKRAYRVMTAGGKPPTSCEGRPENFEMNYATEYWFYK